MKYKKIRLAFKHYEDRFFRVIAVPENINLTDLACVFCTATGAEFEHTFLFDVPHHAMYLPDTFLESGSSDTERPMGQYSLKDLPAQFDFLYDPANAWEFACTVENEYIPAHDAFAFLLDGKGQGIWEDTSYTLKMYLEGELSGDLDEEDAEAGVYFPWNYEIEKLSDFDTAFHLAEEAEGFSERCRDIAVQLRGEPEETAEEFPGHGVYCLTEDAVDYMLSHTFDLIQREEYIRAVFERLSKKYGNDDALKMIAAVLAEKVLDLLQGHPAEDEYYHTRIERLK